MAHKKVWMSHVTISVLLSKVNDSANTLEQLSRKLFKQGVLPYYCHLLDKVSGAEHFLVQNQRGGVILEELRKKLPGYLVPKFMTEIEGEPYKTQLKDF